MYIDFHSFSQNIFFCLSGLSLKRNICLYQLWALWNVTHVCSKSPTELEKKNKTLQKNRKVTMETAARQLGRASNQLQTAILPHTKSSSLISPLISPSSDTLNLKSAAAASWRPDLVSFRGCWGWSVPRSADPLRVEEVWRLWKRALLGDTCLRADGKTNVDILHLQDPKSHAL